MSNVYWFVRMNLRHPRVAVFGIWGLVAAFRRHRGRRVDHRGRRAATAAGARAGDCRVDRHDDPGGDRDAADRRARADTDPRTSTSDRDASTRSSSSRCGTPSWRSSRGRSTCRSRSSRWRSASSGSCRAIASGSRCCRRTARSSRPTPSRADRTSAAPGRVPELVFRTERTALGTVVRSREPLTSSRHQRGGRRLPGRQRAPQRRASASALMVPLVAKGRAVGTLNVVVAAEERVSAAAHRRADADRRDLRGRLRRAAAPDRGRQIPVDGVDVGG